MTLIARMGCTIKVVIKNDNGSACNGKYVMHMQKANKIHWSVACTSKLVKLLLLLSPEAFSAMLQYIVAMPLDIAKGSYNSGTPVASPS